MIKITNATRELTKIEKYLMTVSPSIISMKDLEDGTKIKVSAVIEFEDIKEDGEISEICAILDEDKKAYALQSDTFKRSLFDIIELMENEPFTIIKVSGETKNKRAYINCILDVESIA